MIAIICADAGLVYDWLTLNKDEPMRQPALLAACTGLSILMAGVVAAQQHDPKMHGHGSTHAGDTRVLVDMPPNLVVHMLANMRDHLQAVQEIQEAS